MTLRALKTELLLPVLLERDRHGNLVTRPSLRPVSLFHCLTRKASSFLYAWLSFVICAVTFPVSGKTSRPMRRCAILPGGKRNRHLPLRPRPALIPIVTTANPVDAVELAQTSTRSFPVQENIIRDFLLPLGLDTPHGYGKTPIVNAEVAREACCVREALEQCPALGGFRTSPLPPCFGALRSARGAQTKDYGDELYRKLNAHQDALAAQGVDYDERRAQIKAEKAVIDAELEQRWQRVWRTYSKSSKESEKQERYAVAHCDLLGALEDLAATERTMYETSQAQRSSHDGL